MINEKQSLLKRVQHLEKMRQDFVANVSHELRTPLTVIHGYLETLLKEFKDNAHLEKIFSQMFQQSIRMERLVEDLLLLSRLETDTPNQEDFKPIAVATLLPSIINDAKALSGEENHRITLKADKNLKILGLENELISAFSNLIFNAVNYTPSAGKVEVHWFRDEQYAYFKVSDTGIGIAPEHIERITERFYRVDRDRSRKSGGTGLGLAIVKHILIRHGAKLKIKSVLDEGSCFTCVFPRA